MYIDEPLLARVIDRACTSLAEILSRAGCLRMPPRVEASGAADLAELRRLCSAAVPMGVAAGWLGWGSAGGAPRAAAAAEPFGIRFRLPADTPQIEQASDEQNLVNALCGLMWNIPITERHRSILAGHWAFFPCIAAVLSQRAYRRSHFSCLHVLTTLRANGVAPVIVPGDDESGPSFGKYLRGYLDAQDPRSRAAGAVPAAADQLQATENIGVALSLRDVADFFVPLLRSRDLDCVAFGYWAMTVFYWNATDIYA